MEPCGSLLGQQQLPDSGHWAFLTQMAKQTGGFGALTPWAHLPVFFFSLSL